MFGFFKKHEKKDDHENVCTSEVKTGTTVEHTDNSQKIEEKINDVKAQIKSLIDTDDEKLKLHVAELLEELAGLYESSNQIDEAIGAYEQSLSNVQRMGKSYQRLLILYNKKRACAASTGNDEEMKLYFEKVQALMQSSKDMIRGK